jgi:hypothetical protein
LLRFGGSVDLLTLALRVVATLPLAQQLVAVAAAPFGWRGIRLGLRLLRCRRLLALRR